MNVSDLKPIDARIMKPGDPVVNAEGKPARLIAYVPDAAAGFQAVILEQTGIVNTSTYDGRQISSSPVVWFLPPDPDPIDPDPIDPSPGNVDKLRKSQVGEGWRIPAYDEKPDRRAQVWRISRYVWDTRGVDLGLAYKSHLTYRVPIAPIRMVPLAREDFIGKPWPLVKTRDATPTFAVVGIHNDGLWCGSSHFVSWRNLQSDAELSYDHGKTWVRAEKEEA